MSRKRRNNFTEFDEAYGPRRNICTRPGSYEPTTNVYSGSNEYCSSRVGNPGGGGCTVFAYAPFRDPGYGTFYSDAPQTIIAGGKVVFTGTLSTPPAGLYFIPGTYEIRVNHSGIYQIQYSLRTMTSIGAVVELLVNNAVVPHSEITCAEDIGQPTGYATVSLSAGDEISIKIEHASISPTTASNAFLNILRIA